MNKVIKADIYGTYHIPVTETGSFVGVTLDSPSGEVAAKNDQSKPDLSLIPKVLLTEIAKAFHGW